MKLASYKGGRDGRLMIVSRDLQRAAPGGERWPHLQAALDDWEVASPQLKAIYDSLNTGAAAGAQAFDPAQCGAPLPRAYSWQDGSVFVNHMRLMFLAQGREISDEMTNRPMIYQGGSDTLLGPHDDIVLAEDEPWGVDLEAELAIITGDVPMATSAAGAGQHILLIALLNDVSLRLLQPREMASGFGCFISKPSTAFAPVVVTPDELGDSWRDGRVHLDMLSYRNGEPFGRPNAGVGMDYSFCDLIAHATTTRALCAGAIIGSGTISNAQPPETSRVSDGGVGYSCISEARAIDMIRHGEPRTPFLSFGERVRIEMMGPDGRSVFGAIDQAVCKLGS